MDTASNGSSSGGAGGGAGQHRPVQVWFVVPFRLLCQICLALPLAGLVACLLMAVVFQFGDIQETACQVRTLNDDLNLGTWYVHYVGSTLLFK